MMNWVLSVSLLPGKSIWLSSRPEKAMSARPSARAATDLAQHLGIGHGAGDVADRPAICQARRSHATGCRGAGVDAIIPAPCRRDQRRPSPMTTPTHAEIVIIGGGIIGCSIAYHLTRMGQTRRGDPGEERRHPWRHLACRGSGRPAPLLAQRHPHAAAQRRALRQAGTGDGPGHRLEEGGKPAPGLLAGAAAGGEARRHHGQELRPGDADHRRQGGPGAVPADDAPRACIAAAFLPSDGYVDPASVAQALAKGARMEGAKIIEGVARHGHRGRGPARHAGADRAGRLRLRDPGQCRRHVGPRDRADDGHARAVAGHRASVSRDRSHPRHAEEHADPARSRSAGLLQAGGARHRRRRL